MTEVLNDRRARYVVTNPVGQNVFDIDFPLSDTDYIRVYQDGVLVDAADYVVDLVGLTVTLNSVAAQGIIVVLEGLRDLERTENYPLKGGLRSRLLNSDFDAIVQALQEMRRDTDRGVQLNKSEGAAVSNSMPLLSEGKTLVWGPNGLVNGPDASGIIAASSYADAAEASKDAAAIEALSAAAAAASAAALLDQFDDRYLGPKSSDPVLDNDGAALVDGALYYNITDSVTKIYDLGLAAWQSLNIEISDGSISFVKLSSGALANQSEAEAGTATNKLMTPKQTAQAIEALSPGGGALVPIATETVTTDVDSVEFLTGSDYKNFVIVGSNVFASSGDSMMMRLSANGGSTWNNMLVGQTLLAFGSTVVASGTTDLKIARYLDVNPGSFTVSLYSLTEAGATQYNARATGGNGHHCSSTGYGPSAVHDAIQLYIDGGQFGSGRFTLYGLKEA